jgi:hypothetical protein
MISFFFYKLLNCEKTNGKQSLKIQSSKKQKCCEVEAEVGVQICFYGAVLIYSVQPCFINHKKERRKINLMPIPNAFKHTSGPFDEYAEELCLYFTKITI